MSPEKDSAQLALAGRTIRYEATMLDRTSRLLVNEISDRATRYAVLESFIVHARQLTEFLVAIRTRSRFPSDVVAGDFFSPPDSWAALAGQHKNDLCVDEAIGNFVNIKGEKDRDREYDLKALMDRTVMHMTTGRAEPDEKITWYPIKIRDDLVRRLHTFAGQAHRLDSESKNVIVRLSQLPPPSPAGGIRPLTTTGW